MKQQHHQKSETVRLTIDLSIRQHKHLKMLAAEKGVSMRQYVIESVCKKVEQEASDAEFQKAKKKIFKENSEILKRLADK